MRIAFDCYGDTDIGRARSNNEDNFIIASLVQSMRIGGTSAGLDQRTRLFGESQGNLLAVADGLGGHESGQRASALAIDTVARHCLNELSWSMSDRPSDDVIQKRLVAAVNACQQAISDEVVHTPQSAGMGTTLTLAYIAWPQLYVVHVGDSRCYLLRDGELRQLTRDHTLAQLFEDDSESEKAAAGRDDLPSHPEHILWNVIGGTLDELEPEFIVESLKAGDKLLLCSDGLTRHLPDEHLADRLKSSHGAQTICEQLIEDANQSGGRDNITAIVAHFATGKESSGEGESESKSRPLDDSTTVNLIKPAASDSLPT